MVVQETEGIVAGICCPACGLFALQALVELGWCKQPFCYAFLHAIEVVVVYSLKY